MGFISKIINIDLTTNPADLFQSWSRDKISRSWRLLVGGWATEKYEFVSWDYEIPNIWKNKIHVPNHQPGYIKFIIVKSTYSPQLPSNSWRLPHRSSRGDINVGPRSREFRALANTLMVLGVSIGVFGAGYSCRGWWTLRCGGEGACGYNKIPWPGIDPQNYLMKMGDFAHCFAAYVRRKACWKSCVQFPSCDVTIHIL
jgi:hypothetical protein